MPCEDKLQQYLKFSKKCCLPNYSETIGNAKLTEYMWNKFLYIPQTHATTTNLWKVTPKDEDKENTIPQLRVVPSKVSPNAITLVMQDGTPATTAIAGVDNFEYVLSVDFYVDATTIHHIQNANGEIKLKMEQVLLGSDDKPLAEYQTTMILNKETIENNMLNLSSLEFGKNTLRANVHLGKEPVTYRFYVYPYNHAAFGNNDKPPSLVTFAK